MIDEAVGKILGMAMAYAVSALGLFLAYVNYRKRIVGADRVMTPKAWAVVATIVVVIAAGVLVVGQLAQRPGEQPEAAVAPTPEAPPAPSMPAPTRTEGPRWPLLGMVLPATIFLFATWVTAALYRHFSRAGHHQ